jgi:hypothetical protein
MRHALAFLLMACSPLPAAAQSSAPDDGAWHVSGDRLEANAAGISLPQSAGGLALGKSGEISDQGEALDNYAQYTSADGVVQATAYVYLPGYADGAVSAYMTDKAILDRFGPSTRRTMFTTAAAGGRAGTALRSVYSAADGALVTAAAFVHAGRWLVKLRVTGPAERAGEVTAGLDGLLGGMAFADPAAVRTLTAAPVADCPAREAGEAQIIKAGEAPRQDAMTTASAFPRDGQDRLCVREQVKVGADSYDVLQAQGAGAGAQTILIPLDDAGKVMRFERLSGGAGYQLMIHQVGRTDIYNAYDRLPNARQIAAIIDGKDQKGATRIASASHGPHGNGPVIAAPAAFGRNGRDASDQMR